MEQNLFLSCISSKMSIKTYQNVNNIVQENISLHYSIRVSFQRGVISRRWIVEFENDRISTTREYPFLFNTCTLVTQSLSTDYAYTRKNRVSRGWALRPIPCTWRDKYFYNFTRWCGLGEVERVTSPEFFRWNKQV